MVSRSITKWAIPRRYSWDHKWYTILKWHEMIPKWHTILFFLHGHKGGFGWIILESPAWIRSYETQHLQTTNGKVQWRVQLTGNHLLLSESLKDLSYRFSGSPPKMGRWTSVNIPTAPSWDVSSQGYQVSHSQAEVGDIQGTQSCSALPAASLALLSNKSCEPTLGVSKSQRWPDVEAINDHQREESKHQQKQQPTKNNKQLKTSETTNNSIKTVDPAY